MIDEEGDMLVVQPRMPPRPADDRLQVECPWCGSSVTYEAEEDDGGIFHAVQDHPICAACDVVISVPGVVLSFTDDTPFSVRRYR